MTIDSTRNALSAFAARTSVQFKIAHGHASFRLICFAATAALVLAINSASLVAYGYFFAVWSFFIYVFDRPQFRDFVQAFLVNGLLAAIYVLIQSHFYPEYYGCTSVNAFQTDDSYFFSLVADDLPLNLETRAGYFMYEYPFTNFIRFIIPFSIRHPLDVLFFMSGVAGLICVYTQQLTVQFTGSRDAGYSAYLLCQFCPLFLMNGGAVFVRDTCAAALFIASLCFIVRARIVSLACCLALQFYLRPGTAIISLPLYVILFLPDIAKLSKSIKSRTRVMPLILMVVAISIAYYIYQEELWQHLEMNQVNVNELQREGIDELFEQVGRGAFMWVLSQPLEFRLPLSMAYMYLQPFLAFSNINSPFGFDTRLLLNNVAYPVWFAFVNAWVFASLFVKGPSRPAVRATAAAFLMGCFLIGVFSLESRHKVMIQPLFYVMAATGLHLAPEKAKSIGYGCSALWLVAEVAYAIATWR